MTRRRRLGPAGPVLVCAALLGGCSGTEAPVAGGASASAGVSSREPTPLPAPGGTATRTATPTATPTTTPTVVEGPVAPPGGEGDLDPVPTVAVLTLPAVPIDEPALVERGLEVRIGGVEAVEVVGRGPGQVSGPAVAVTVTVSNDGPTDLDVAGLAVSLAYADTEAGPVDGPPAEPVSGPVPAGTDVSGTYVFLVPEDQRRSVTVRVGLASQPVVIFTGRATS